MRARLPLRTLAAAVTVAACVTTAGCSAGPSAKRPTTTSSRMQPPHVITHASRWALRTTTAPWSRPDNQAALVRAAGMTLTPTETLAVHYHAHLDVLVDGSPVTVPAGLGINVSPGGTPPRHGTAGIAPLHTHDTSGVLHIEAPRREKFTLGQVFTEWGVLLQAGLVGGYARGDAAGDDVQVYVNGHRWPGDPTLVVLRPHEEVAVVVSDGTTPVHVPSSYSFPSGE